MSSSVAQKQEKMFFLQQSTLDALDAIVGSEKLVIYCGAGVTVDQTGVSWTELIQQVFGVAVGAKTGRSTKYKSVEFLLSVMDDPRQVASIVTEAFRTDRVIENDFLKTALLHILYTKSTWSTGQILRNVAQFAINASIVGRDVTIITTNYDAYIEKEIDFRFEALKTEPGFPTGRTPGVFRTRHEPGAEPVPVRVINAQGRAMTAEGGAGEIELIYLHGRIDQGGATEGVLVLTEDSYARTRDISRQILQRHFERSTSDGSAKAVLIVGASLTDGPLIDALAVTHERTPPAGARPQIRVALTDLPLTKKDLATTFDSKIDVEIDSGHVRDALALRGKHLGVDILWPASHSQTAQFLEEMRVDLVGRKRHARVDAYVAADLGISYAARLKRWETQFQTSQTMLDQGFVHNHLSVINEAIKLELKHHKFDAESETLRLELWARTKPSSRRMVLIGNSTGPLSDRSALRDEAVDCMTNASIVAFLEGRPLLRSIEQLDPDLISNRWQTFFSVPIFVNVEGEDDNGAGRVPAGVITLASTLSVTHEIKGHWSVFRDLESPDFEKLKFDSLIPTGKGLLSPERAAERWEDYDINRLSAAQADTAELEKRAAQRPAKRAG